MRNPARRVYLATACKITKMENRVSRCADVSTDYGKLSRDSYPILLVGFPTVNSKVRSAISFSSVHLSLFSLFPSFYFFLIHISHALILARQFPSPLLRNDLTGLLLLDISLLRYTLSQHLYSRVLNRTVIATSPMVSTASRRNLATRHASQASRKD